MTGLQPTKLIRLRHSLVPLDPETMGRFFIINAPYLFSGVWSLIKPWLDEVTVKKISIPGRDWKAQLLAQIPAENLEVRFGGTSKGSAERRRTLRRPTQDPGTRRLARRVRFLLHCSKVAR